MPSLRIHYQPLNKNLHHDDAVPVVGGQNGIPLEAPLEESAKEWSFVFRGPVGRRELLWSDLRGHTLIPYGVLARPADSVGVGANLGRPDAATIASIGPAILDLRDWEKVFVSQEEPCRWIPKPSELSDLMEGKKVALPAQLQQVPPDQIVLAIPSMSPGIGGRQVLRGSAMQRIETALLLGTQGQDGTYHPNGLSPVHQNQWTTAFRSWTNALLSVGEEYLPFATLTGEGGNVQIERYAAPREGRLDKDAMMLLLPYLVEREKAWKNTSLDLSPEAREWSAFRGGFIQVGQQVLGIAPDSLTLAQVSSDLHRSSGLIAGLCSIDDSKPVQAPPMTRNSEDPFLIDPKQPLVNWDPRGFVNFLRQLDITFPSRENTNESQVDHWIHRALQYADQGVCISAKTFFERLGNHVAQTTNGAVSGAKVFHDYLAMRLVRATVDHCCAMEIVGEDGWRSLQVGGQKVPGSIEASRPRPLLLQYHLQSSMEKNAADAGRATAFAAKATADTSIQSAVSKLCLPVHYPSHGMAILGGLTPTYSASRVDTLFVADSPTDDTQAVATLTGLSAGHWLGEKDAPRHGDQGHGVPIQDQALQSLVAVLSSAPAQRLSDYLNIHKSHGEEMSAAIHWRVNLASYGLAQNVPSSDIVTQALKGELLPTDRTCSLRKHTNGYRVREQTQKTVKESGWVDISADEAAGIYQGALRRYKNQQDQNLRLLQVETGNPFLLGRVPLIHPTRAGAEREVGTWLRAHVQEVGDIAAAPKKQIPEPAEFVAAKQHLAAIKAAMDEYARIDQQIQMRLLQQGLPGPKQEDVLQCEGYYQAHSALTLLRHQAVASIPPESVRQLAVAWSASPASQNLGDGDAPGSLIQPEGAAAFTHRLQQCGTSKELIREVEKITGMTLSEEARKLLETAEVDRRDRQARTQALAQARRACIALETTSHAIHQGSDAAKCLRWLFPEFGGLHPDVVRRVGQLFMDPGSTTIAVMRSHVDQLHKDAMLCLTNGAQKVAMAEKIVPVFRAAVDRLCSLPHLAMPLVAQAKYSEKGFVTDLKVGGYGGAYFAFLRDLMPAAKAPAIEFDSAGILQQHQMQAWSRAEFVTVDSQGVVNGGDRRQLSSLGQIRNTPDTIAPVCCRYVSSQEQFLKRSTEVNQYMGSRMRPTTPTPTHVANRPPAPSPAHDL